MMTKLVNLARKNKLFEIVIKAFIWIMMAVINAWDEFTGFLRCHGVLGNQYSDIKALKGKYDGKRCFIICTGPSLTTEDLDKIRDEYTFGMNSICLLDDKTSFRPTFYGCNDLGVYKKLKTSIEQYCGNQIEVFVSDRIKRHGDIKKGWHVFPENVAYHTYDRWFKQNFWCKFSGDCYRTIYGMHSITHSLIQLAVYMGFKEIYLLGADCNFPKGKQIHFQDYGVPDTTIDTARERNIAGYKEVKKQMNQYGFTVFNATRGGALEVFERVNLDDLLKEDE
jgi:hypothetical protein